MRIMFRKSIYQIIKRENIKKRGYKCNQLKV